MIGRKLSLVVVALAAASAGCQPAAQEAGPLSDADAAAIQGVIDALIEADLAGDWDAVAALFADDAVFMMPDRPALEGKAAWRAMVDEMQPTIHAVTVDVAEIEGRGDLAYVRGTYSETLSFGENEPFDLEGKFVWIMKRQSDGSWLVTVGISNSNQPASDTDS
ncbi:MAG: nuclear transport factor 2 family protein [Gemmatimonadota bacterium]|nr:MAG: nuclear transport factor 2 family protein [Gemmatimonadota bacterium]